ncbi:MAG: outer membrane protein assembly factor BamC [Candidatus Thiodiazotropha sp.]
MRLTLSLLPIPFLLLLLFGCSSDGGYFSDSEREYRTQKETVDDLEVPPDLTSSTIQDAMAIPGAGSASYEEYASQREKRAGGSIVAEEVLPEFENIQVERDGDQRWLVIQAPPEKVWPKVVDFWRKNGLLLVEQNPAIGVMKTDWLESRADIKQGPITEFFRKALSGIYSSATRDQFRVRLERGEEPNTTELYLTHRGLEERLKEDVSGEADTTYWTPRPNDPGIEAAMLRSLMVDLGVAQERAEASLAVADQHTDRSRLELKGADSELWINEAFARAWRLTGVALDRVGFAVEDRDRSSGIYYVKYSKLLSSDQKKEEGFLSRLAFWEDEDDEIPTDTQYQVKLHSVSDEETLVEVRDDKGEPALAKAAEQILSLIHQQIL